MDPATTDISPTTTSHNEDSLAIVDVVSTGVVQPRLAKVGQFGVRQGAIEVVLLHCAASNIPLLYTASVASGDDDAILKLDGTCLPENQYVKRMYYATSQ